MPAPVAAAAPPEAAARAAKIAARAAEVAATRTELGRCRAHHVLAWHGPAQAGMRRREHPFAAAEVRWHRAARRRHVVAVVVRELRAGRAVERAARLDDAPAHRGAGNRGAAVECPPVAGEGALHAAQVAARADLLRRAV